jgi:hypothetical protein
MEALADHNAVGVRAVVVTHLGREPTRSELEAARRAARLLEQRGQLKVVHVSVPPRLNQRGGTFLVATAVRARAARLAGRKCTPDCRNPGPTPD